MYFYFSAEYLSAIKLNGAYFGLLGNEVKSVNIDQPEKTLVEIIPLNGNNTPTNFLLNQDFLSSPNVATVIDLKGGYFISLANNFILKEFSVLAQEKYADCVATVFCDGQPKLSIETPNSFFTDTLSMRCDSVKIERFFIDGCAFIGVIINDNYLTVYCISSEVNKVFSEQVNNYSFDNGLYTEIIKKDIAKHKIRTIFGYDGTALTVKERTVNTADTFIRENLPDKVLPYAFIEEFLVGGDYKYYLSEKVSKNADKLGGYLKDFVGIMPPPKFRDVNEIGLIYKEKENLFSVEYFTFTLVDGKIDNVKKATE